MKGSLDSDESLGAVTKRKNWNFGPPGDQAMSLRHYVLTPSRERCSSWMPCEYFAPILWPSVT